ncbi:adrenodoxin [Amia ocellicauda]|uniref:adrenodoxin n=1 Tax=Amia ocellicauda TaxID=2972642 RepID=UPI0034642021
MLASAAAQRALCLSQSLLLKCRAAVSVHKPLSTVVLSGRRGKACSRNRAFSSYAGALRSEDKVTVHFINRDGEKITVKANLGESLLDVVIDQNLDFDGFGACEGTLACSTCHLIFEDDTFKKLEPITDEEMDMLDLAYGLTDTSRLGCQICLRKSLDGMVVRVPESVADVRQSADMGTTSS